MLTSIDVFNSQGNLLQLSLSDVSDGFVVADVQGLNPVKATLVSSSFANMDGEQYHSSRRESRNLVLTLDLEPDYITTSVSDLRKQLYKFFMPKSAVNLVMHTSDGLAVNISGIIEDFDAPQFTKEPTATISIMCFNPDFVDPNKVVVSALSSSGGLAETIIDYQGDIETGIVFTLKVNRSITQFTFTHRPPDGTLRTLDFAASLVAGDVVTITTIPGSKAATLTRAGSVSSILYAVSPQSNWIALQNGSNRIHIFVTGAAIPYTISYNNKYGGL